MFAPKIAKPQTKAAAASTNKLAPQRLAFATRPFGGCAVEQAHLLQSTIGNQAALRPLSQQGLRPTRGSNSGDHEQEGTPENITAKEVKTGISWNFSKIPLFPPDRTNRPQAPFPLVAPPPNGVWQRSLPLFPSPPGAGAAGGYTISIDSAEQGAPAGDEPAFAGQTSPAPSAATGAQSASPGPAAPQPGFLSMLTMTRASAPDGTGNLRRTVGAGELVDFFPQTSPNVLDLAGTPANWTATAGTPASAPAVPVFTWAAPEAAGNVTITATLTGSAQSVSTTITTLGPSAISAEKTSEDSIPAGTEGAGMQLKLRYSPLSVSFDNILELEDPMPATNVSGYFQKVAQAGVDLSHHPNPNWTPLNGNSVIDHAFVHAPPLRNPPAWEQGHFDWSIPNRYLALVPGRGVAGPGIVFTTTLQTFDMLGTDGTIMITKENATVVRSPSGLSGVRALRPPTAPGDYPTPGNPLDLPQTDNTAPSASGRTI